MIWYELWHYFLKIYISNFLPQVLYLSDHFFLINNYLISLAELINFHVATYKILYWSLYEEDFYHINVQFRYVIKERYNINQKQWLFTNLNCVIPYLIFSRNLSYPFHTNFSEALQTDEIRPIGLYLT